MIICKIADIKYNANNLVKCLHVYTISIYSLERHSKMLVLLPQIYEKLHLLKL